VKGVSAICLRVVLDVGKRRGISPERLLSGLDAYEEDILSAPWRRYPWDTYVELIERMTQEVGGYEAAVRAASEMHDTVPELRALLTAFVSIPALYRFILCVIDPFVFPMIENTVDELPDGKLRVTGQIRPGYRDCLAYHHATLGALTTIPLHIGAPAVKKAEILELDGARAVYLIELSPSRTVRARVKRWFAAVSAPNETSETANAHENLRAASSGARAFSDDLEARLMREEIRLRGQLEGALSRVLDTVSNSAFLVTRDTVAGANANGTASLEREGVPLRTCLLGIARGVPAPPNFETTSLGTNGQMLVIRRGLGDEVARRLEQTSRRLALTPRQTDVLRGLVDGLSNAEIAERLGCTVRTVETHLTALLDRADASSRLQIVADFWTHG
jgi:DNA-binding CsgD family transcriptional regulator